MLNLPRPARDDTVDLDLAIATTMQPLHGATLTALKPRLLTAYDAYEAAITGVGTCSPLSLTETECGAMEFTYEALGTRVDLIPIRAELLDATVLGGYCPMCGVNQVSTLDHHAAKEKWAEFACFSLNLVPTCPTCNNKKRALTGPTLETIPFVHPYLHAFPNDPILNAEVHVAADSVSVSFFIAEPAAGAGEISMKALAHQVEKLDILGRIEIAANGELVAAAVSCRTIGEYGGAAEVVAQCEKMAASQATTWGTNHWRAVLYRALAASAPFCSGGYELIP